MSRVQQMSVKAVFFKFRVVRVVAGIRNLVMGTSLFSLVRVRRFTVMARSLFALLGKFCLDSKQNLESGRGVLKLTKVLAQAEKYDCICG
jgi:hypothetical protein